jgi:tRNA (guanine37-N1)-methyltransferase
MIAALSVTNLDKHDLALLAELGWVPDPDGAGLTRA